ncbi:T9SS type A sorting domain-containing protein [Polaribacter tangerinus]|uniref:T9SS type A sorting domain-containing protein n=1 Tax=Polaribacter tangerinus TaxID=1920034 RepID=UPI000B4AF022|nr:T9SS type A sorting domain-containing protein [Polaribacter tangerinus]
MFERVKKKSTYISIIHTNSSDQGEFGYGQTIFAQLYSTTDNANNVVDNSAEFKTTTSATIVNHDSTSDLSFFFRQGTKTGHSTNDWIAASKGSGSFPNWQLTGTSSKINREYFKNFQLNTEINYGVTNPTEPNEWLGITNDWATNTNWSLGFVPVEGEVTTISNGLDPIINTNTGAKAENITLTGKTLMIENGGSLIATGTVTGNITYKRTLTKDNNLTSAWYAVSPPVSGENLTTLQANNSFASGSVSGRIGVGIYKNDGTDWTYFTTTSTDAIDSGTGLIVKLDINASGSELSFTGTYTSGKVETPISVNGANSFNFIGNPFTAYINLGDFFSDNSATNRLSENTIWIWDENKNGSNMGGYVQKMMGTDASFEIAPGQGFFVSSGTAASNKIEFNTSNQSHQSDSFLKTENNKALVTINVSQENMVHQTKLYFIAGTTKSFDNGYDASLFGGKEYSLAIYTDLAEENKHKKLSIQSLPLDEINAYEIPIGIVSDANKEITISANSANLPSGTKLFIEDRLLNTFTEINVNNSSYKTSSKEKLNGTGRFFLHTSQKSLSTKNNSLLNTISIYKADNTTLRVAGLEKTNTNFKLFNILGKQLVNTNFIANGTKEISLPKVAKGIYLVKITTENGSWNKKIIIE